MLRPATPRFRRAITLASFAGISALAFVTGVACESSTSTSILPTTGILVRAETLTTGRGCGTGPTQLYKYAVVVFGYDGSGDPTNLASYTKAVESSVFDCFSDGAFVSLSPNAGSSNYRLEVFAYNELAYSAARSAIEAASARRSEVELRGTTPTWTTECRATQQTEVQTLAVCGPLAAGLAGLVDQVAAVGTKISLETTSFRLADGRLATCAATASDGGVDASADADADTDGGAADAEAADAEAADAAAPSGLSFTTARIRYRVGSAEGPTVDVTCPAPFVAEVAGEPYRYEVDVGLLDSTGSPVGETMCSVTTQPGKTSSAVCP